MSNFVVAGPDSDWMVLGAIATRVEGTLLSDATKMEGPEPRARQR